VFLSIILLAAYLLTTTAGPEVAGTAGFWRGFLALLKYSLTFA
jgi:hypothetical protein